MVVPRACANADRFTAHKIYFEARPQSGLFVFVEHQTTGGTNMKEVIATVALVCMSCICLIGLGAIVYCMATGY